MVYAWCNVWHDSDGCIYAVAVNGHHQYSETATGGATSSNASGNSCDSICFIYFFFAMPLILMVVSFSVGAWWLSGRFGALCPEGCMLEPHSV